MQTQRLHQKVAPEIVRPRSASETILADLWSVGILSYLVIVGRLPFSGSTQTEILQQILTMPHDVVYPKGVFVSAPCKAFIGRLLCDVAHRMTAKEALRHQWLSGTTRSLHSFEAEATAFKTGELSFTLEEAFDVEHVLNALDQEQEQEEEEEDESILDVMSYDDVMSLQITERNAVCTLSSNYSHTAMTVLF